MPGGECRGELLGQLLIITMLHCTSASGRLRVERVCVIVKVRLCVCLCLLQMSCPVHIKNVCASSFTGDSICISTRM